MNLSSIKQQIAAKFKWKLSNKYCEINEDNGKVPIINYLKICVLFSPAIQFLQCMNEVIFRSNLLYYILRFIF